MWAVHLYLNKYQSHLKVTISKSLRRLRKWISFNLNVFQNDCWFILIYSCFKTNSLMNLFEYHEKTESEWLHIVANLSSHLCFKATFFNEQKQVLNKKRSIYRWKGRCWEWIIKSTNEVTKSISYLLSSLILNFINIFDNNDICC